MIIEIYRNFILPLTWHETSFTAKCHDQTLDPLYSTIVKICFMHKMLTTENKI